mmetsp:Transcript_19716/g.28774  ORF Transcript_19716/g.28774 Transcript_19716/m.28774 type:complete len:164 (-) Transcript_19716:1718-2209(-)
MGKTKTTQRKAKIQVDEKLRLSRPSRDLLESLAVDCASKPSSDNTFQYAFALAKSDSDRELEYAVSILDQLVKEKYEHQVDCYVGAATALYLLKDYEKARARCEAVLRSSPDNRNIAELHLACIQGEEEQRDQKIKRKAVEGTLGVAAVGLALGIAGMMVKRR